MCRKFLTIIAIALSEISHGSFIQSNREKQNTFPAHCGDGATKLKTISRAAS